MLGQVNEEIRRREHGATEQAAREQLEASLPEGLRGRVTPPHGDGDDQVDAKPKRNRSTRRRQDAPELASPSQ